MRDSASVGAIKLVAETSPADLDEILRKLIRYSTVREILDIKNAEIINFSVHVAFPTPSSQIIVTIRRGMNTTLLLR